MKDIEERTFRFAVRIVKLCQVLNESSGIARIISRQLLRSGTSVGANVHEAQAGQSRPDFISKNSIALKEAHETAYWLKLLAHSNTVSSERLIEISKECGEIIAILTTIVKRARENWKKEQEKGKT